MDDLPLAICKIINQYKEAFELIDDQPEPEHFISRIFAEERNIIVKICALNFATILRARDILDASADLVQYYMEAEKNWNKRHEIWDIVPVENPPSCRNNLGYLVYQWLSLEGPEATVDGMLAANLLDRIALW